jgi:sterol desaturase/sphingolipid hydroxylase (fatty acid hydroxylase superfamily)
MLSRLRLHVQGEGGAYEPTLYKNRRRFMGMSMDWLKGLLLNVLIFVPLERMLARHPEQRVFRRGWMNDMIYLLLNGQIIVFWLGALIIGVTMAAGWLMPVSLRAAVAGQPYWLQIVEVIVLADTGFYFADRAFHAIVVMKGSLWIRRA